MVKGDQLLDATIVVSLAISLGNAGVTQTPRVPGPKVRIMVIQAVAIKDMVMAMVVVMGRPMVGPMLWMPMNIRVI